MLHVVSKALWLVAVLCAACGGGGSNGGSAPSPTPPPLTGLVDSGVLFMDSCTQWNSASRGPAGPNDGKCEYRYVFNADVCKKDAPCDNLLMYLAPLNCSGEGISQFLVNMATIVPGFAVACVQPLAPGEILPVSLGAPQRDIEVMSTMLNRLKDPAQLGVWSGKNLLFAGNSLGATRYPVVAARYTADDLWLGTQKTAACMSDGVVNIGYQDRFIAEGPGGLASLSCESRHNRIINAYSVRTAAQSEPHSCDTTADAVAGHCACNPTHAYPIYAGDCGNGDCAQFDTIVERKAAGWAFAEGVSAQSFAVRHWKLMEEGSSFANTTDRCSKDVVPAEPFRALCTLLNQDANHSCTFVSKPLASHSVYYTNQANFKSECIDWFNGL